MKQIFLVDQEVVSGVLYPHNSDNTNAKKSEISTKNRCLQLQEVP